MINIKRVVFRGIVIEGFQIVDCRMLLKLQKFDVYDLSFLKLEV